jgi:hypothetical protein
MISLKEITDAWRSIQVSDQKHKFYKLIYLNSKTKIRASIKRDENLKSVEFIFPKLFFSKKNFNFKETKGLKVTIESEVGYENELIICIYLKTENFLDIYLNLLEKIINYIFDSSDFEKNIQIIFEKLISWRRCFENDDQFILSFPEQLGLFGELCYIERLFSNKITPEEILISWKGPEGGLHDFLIKNNIYEIKTFLNKNKKIRISNINQFDYKTYKNLTLVCAELEESNIGLNISSLVQKIKTEIFSKKYNTSKFEDKLANYGYFEYQSNKYTRSFILKNFFDYFVNQDFPTILPENLAKGIIDVSFNLDIKFIENHKKKL